MGADHPEECAGPVERLDDVQASLPWGSDVERTLEWCSTCGWKRQRTKTAT